ncbi:hypothetical protein AVEN_9258-1 [Araneus ventricosus]|uniref:Helitron helicase-like domain-containing protein n=1 Tax=Araneus ventricosus TaxID=182803 RepID=A0A4Y2QLU6_ARAVE|nr:hypothetical protein AVEN_9258-1 [Araneus ventricosus]
MGTKVVDFSGGGPYVFKVHGQIRHRTSHIQSVNGQASQYVQLYVIDSTLATKIRVNHPANEQCNLRILDQIDRFFRQHNRLSDTYRMLREVESRVISESNEAGEDVPVENMIFRRRPAKVQCTDSQRDSNGFCQQRWRISIRKEHSRVSIESRKSTATIY